MCKVIPVLVIHFQVVSGSGRQKVENNPKGLLKMFEQICVLKDLMVVLKQVGKGKKERETSRKYQQKGKKKKIETSWYEQ